MLPFKYRLLKRFDGVVGRWLCLHMRPTAAEDVPRVDAEREPFRSDPVPPEEVQRLLVVRPGGLGDAVLMFPMLQVLRRSYPDARLEILAEKRNAGLYRINDLVDHVHCYDVNPVATLRGLRARRFDVVIDTEQYHYLSSVICNWLAPRWLVGFDTIGRGRFQTHRVRYTEQRYEAYLFLELAEALTRTPVELEVDRPFLEVDARWTDWARERLAAAGERPVAVIVPSATSEHRLWPPERYAGVLRWLVGEGFYGVLLGGGDAVAASAEITRGFEAGDVADLSGRTSLEQSAGIIQTARIYVSTDTGALHIAYGVGTPTVHMFGSGIQEKWAPPGRRYRVVTRNLPCSPCTRYGYTPPCPYGVECMTAISVEDVTAAVREVLAL